MSEWFVQPEWMPLLKEAGIESYEDAFAFSKGTLLSKKSHSQTRMFQGKQGRIFVKRDSSTRLRASLRNLIHLTRPVAATQKERLKMQRLSALGFHTAQVIAYGGESRLGLPHTAVLITLSVPGRAVDQLWSDLSLAESRRTEVIELALNTLKSLQDKGCDWGKDCKPEHFFITDDNQIHLIDVERMHFRRHPLSDETRAWQLTHFQSLLPS